MTKQQVAMEIIECLAHDYGVIFCVPERRLFAAKMLLLLEFLKQEAEQRQSVYRHVYSCNPN